MIALWSANRDNSAFHADAVPYLVTGARLASTKDCDADGHVVNLAAAMTAHGPDRSQIPPMSMYLIST